MSEVKRWGVETEDGFGIGYGVMDRADNGEYVKYEDYETLEVERDSCHEMLDNYVKMMDEQDKRIADLQEMNAAMEAVGKDLEKQLEKIREAAEDIYSPTYLSRVLELARAAGVKDESI